MPLSVVDLYRDILPKTNCGDCGFSTCLAFASMVVSEKIPIEKCIHLDADTISRAQQELDVQHAENKWTKKDMAQDALEWAKEKAASMAIPDLPDRIGGTLKGEGEDQVLELPYFTGAILIKKDGVTLEDGSPLNRWEQVFVYNHMAQGGSARPTGNWKGLEGIPNTVSKMKSMKEHVEEPLLERFRGKTEELRNAALILGAEDRTETHGGADLALYFRPLPRLPVLLMFWDEDKEEGFEAKVKLLFDETIVEHLDIESIMFLSERIRQFLCES